MKIKTFILTFLMMMSSPFLFGEQTTGANYAWGDAPYLQNQAMMSAKLDLDGVTDYSIYEIGAFCGNEIRGKQRANSTGDFFLSIMLKESSEEISFRLYNHEADLEIFNVYETTTLSDGAHIGGPGNSVDVSATYVAKIGNAAYPTIKEAIAAAQEGETVTILEGNYTQNLDINKAITVQGERNDQDENLVNITGKLNITADGATAKNLNVDNGNENGAYINAKNVTVDGCTVDGGNGFRSCYTTGLVTFKNSTITGDVYGIHFDGSADGEIVIDNCDITGWTSFAKTITKVTMKNGTTFNKGNYNYIRFYQQNVDIDNCTFNENMAIDIAIDGNTTTIDDCTFTNGNIEDLFYDEDIVNSTIIVDGTTLKREASIGNTYYKTLAEALEAVKGISGEVTINLLSDATLDITAWQNLAIGGENTTKIIIDGENGENDFTLTFNKKNSDWSHIATSNNNATDLVLQNIKITDSGYNNGPWNRYDINFACDVELNNVVSTKALAFKAGATLNNVTINEIGDNYAIWIQPNGQNVAIDGLVINSAGRGIKVDEQYVTAQNVNLSVANATFTTVKKAAIMVKSAANTVITVGENVNISSVSADQTNIAWIDEGAAAHYGKVTVTGGTLGQENLPAFAAALMNGEKVEGYYETLPEAITAQTGSEIVKVLKDATGAGAKINKNITIDFNGKTYTFNEGVGSGDLTSNGFQLLGGDVVLKNGTLEVADADASEFYILVQNYTDLKVENMTLDGTNLDKWSKVENNWDSYTLSNNSGEVYIIGSTIKANNDGDKAFAFDVDNNANYTSKPVVYVQNLTDEQDNVTRETLINGNVEVDLPNNLNISGGTFTVEIEEAWCANGFIPVKNDDNTWTVKVGQYVARIGETGYENLDDAFAAAQDGDEVKVLVAGTYALSTSGKDITITGAVDGVVFNNIGAKNMGGANVTFNNVTFNYATNSQYKGLQHSGNLVYNNCTINGQVFLYGESETFNNCIFSTTDSNNYNVWTYGAKEVDFNKCTFNSAGKSVLIYAEGASIFNNVDVKECTFNASAPVDGKAAIEMDSSLTAGINLTIDGETTAEGFGSGNVSNNSLWNNKKGNQGVNNDITVIVDNVVVLAPTTVAKIGETEYNTLQGAITAAGTTTTQIDVVGTTTEENITIADNADITLTFAENVTLNGYFKPFEGNLTINGGTINNTNSGFSAIEITSGKLNLNGVNIASARHAVRIDGAVTATIDGGEYHGGKTEGTRHAINVSGAANVTIKAGTFVGPKGTTADSGSAVNVQSGATVTIEGGNYSGGKNNTLASAGTLVVTGGTFDQDPTKYVAEGYVVEQENNVYSVVAGNVLNQTTGNKYATLQAAIDAASAGNTIVLLKDITEDVTVNNAVTINGEPEENATTNSTYTGKMTVKADLTIKNVNFDGKGYDGYAVETRGANYLTVEDCTAKNYRYGFIQLASGTALTTVKNVSVRDMAYGVKVDYSNAVVLENLNLDCTVAAVLNSNYGTKTITIKNSDLSILGTWTRNNTTKTTYVFEGENTVGQFIIDAAIDNFKLAGVNSTLAAPNEITVTTDMEGYEVEYKDGKYIVVANKVELVRNGESQGKFATLAAAIDAATAGDVIVLLNDITENVTVNKSLTIDGKPAEDAENVKYTGNISVSGNATKATVKNVNFVNGTGYAITTNRINSVTVENCTVNNYGYGFLYANKSTPTVVVKDVTVNGGNYGFHWVYGTTATLENVTMTNVIYGLYNQNHASKTINLKGCNITSIAISEKASANQTFNFEGTNTVGTLSESQYAKYVLAAADATLTAPEVSTVTTSVDGYSVKYEGGVYKVVANNVMIEGTGATFATIQEAIDAAQTGDKVVLLENIELTEADCVVGADRKVLVDVANKDITLDMNGKKISVTHMDEFTNDYIVAVIRVGDGAGLTVTGNGIIDVKTLDNNPDIAYMFWKRGTTGHLTILNGTFRMNDAADSMVYTNGNEIVFIEGGNWTLDAYGTRGNREPWIFNVQGAGDNHVLVRGGTFNADINRQHWSNEVIVPETHYTEVNTENIDDEEITTYTVKEGAEAYVNTGMLTGPYFAPKNIGYATLEEAIAAAVEFRDSPVTLLKDVELEETVIINGNGQESLTIDFAGKVVTSSASPAFRIQDDANVIVTNGNTNTNAYNFILGDSNATSAGNLTIVSGKFHGTTSVVSVTKGHLNITGGEFSVEPYQGNYAYLINCIDANYNNETATVAISGGTFHNWNPQNNAAEGPGTSFCAPGYGAISNGNGTWTVVEAKDVALVRNNEIIEQFASIQAAIDKAQDGDVIKVLEDITLSYEDAEQMCDDNYRSFINVDGKTVTIDLNGCMVKAELGEELEVNYVYGMVTTENEANLTIEDNSEEKTGTMWIDNAVDVYSLVFQYDGSVITINSGNYKLNVGGNGRGMIYSNDDEKVTVNGGNLWLGNVGTKDNGSPWIFNASGTGGKQIIVTGGTYNADINRQHWSDEVFVPETHYTANIGEGTYTIKEGAEAYVNTGMLTGPYYYRKNIGYATLEEAVAAAVDFKDSPVKLLKDVELTETIVINGNGQDLTIDFNEKQVTSSASPAFRIQKDANVIVMNGNMNTENYNFILGASDATSAGNLTIESGNYKGASSVVSVTNGLLTINGGEFEANESEWGSQYLINCIDRYNINGSGIALVSITGGKFHGFNPEDNTAENPQVNFCAPGYGAVETATGSNIWVVMPVHTHDFYTGWRWYSTYIDINGSEGLIRLEDALEDKGLSINHNVDGFVTYEDGMWWNQLATLKETNVKKMYKIEVSGDLEMKLIGNVVDFNEAIEIKTGYNWIGYPFTKAVNLNEAFAETFEPAEGDYMISQFQFAFYYNGSWNGSLVSLNPGEGYIYERVGVDTELKYNVNNTNRNVVKTNISTEDNKWTPNARMYPNNMTMIAVVDGAMGDNYEVAAFVNGEVRGSARPIYIEALDAYMMFLTIHGDEVEEMSFMYYDLTTGESYMLNDRFDYTNDAHLGSVKEPYVFSRGTTGIGDAAMSQVNIYPNPTTTGTEINLEAVCDTVEVFNALGVKVAEYQNVDSIDALETAGIYVIRITNDGNVQNCRLVVK